MNFKADDAESKVILTVTHVEVSFQDGTPSLPQTFHPLCLTHEICVLTMLKFTVRSWKIFYFIGIKHVPVMNNQQFGDL